MGKYWREWRCNAGIVATGVSKEAWRQANGPGRGLSVQVLYDSGGAPALLRLKYSRALGFKCLFISRGFKPFFPQRGREPPALTLHPNTQVYPPPDSIRQYLALRYHHSRYFFFYLVLPVCTLYSTANSFITTYTMSCSRVPSSSPKNSLFFFLYFS